MASVIPVPYAGAQPVGSLLARLGLLESVESADETVMETVADEQQRLLAVIVETPAGALGEVEAKLAALLRRARTNEGFLDDLGVSLLASCLVDLSQLGSARATG